MSGNPRGQSRDNQRTGGDFPPGKRSIGDRLGALGWQQLSWVGMALGVVALAAAVLYRRWRARRARKVPPLPLEVPPGLTEAEAAARWSEDLDNVIRPKPPRTRQQIFRENAFTIFNLTLVALVFMQIIFGQFLNALLSLLALGLNTGLRVSQELVALRRLAELQESFRPTATVMREGQARSVDPSRVVQGDVLVIGPGDQILVDGQVVGPGQLVVDESAVTGRHGLLARLAGDPVYAGSFCVSGRGACMAERVGDERTIVKRLAGGHAQQQELTSLERIINHILRVLLGLSSFMTIVLIARFFRLDLAISTQALTEVASVIFSMAPSGMFLMIVVTYTTGTADLARLGALVHRARSVESLAQATVVCFAEAGILAGTHIELEPAQSTEEPVHPSGSRLRQILGDYARSTSTYGAVTTALAEAFEGSRRTVREEAPFLAVYGWSGIAFEEKDLRGVYILGEPAVMEANLIAQNREPIDTEGRSPAETMRRLASPLSRLLRRRQKETPDAIPDGTPPGQPEPDGARVTEASTDDASAEQGDSLVDAQPRELFLRRWARQVGSRLERREPKPAQPEAPEEQTGEEVVLLFAYRPEIVPLHDDLGRVQLPEGLIPLCELRYARRLHTKAIETIQAFARTGIGIKVFTSGDPEQALSMFRQAALEQGDAPTGHPPRAVSGRDLEGLPSDQWVRIAVEGTAFGQVTPEQAGDLVQALRSTGESVAVVGDGVADLAALQQANLAIVKQTSAQAALSMADIVLMGSSPDVLVRILYKGQRIVNGLMDILKLNLAQVSCLALLVVAIHLLSSGFPHRAAQGTVISLLTVTFPSLGLAFWAPAGITSSLAFGRTLARFVVPAAVSMALAGLVVYVYFLDRTGELAYAQLALTYTLIFSGLLVAMFLRPPRQTGPEEGLRGRDWRMTGLALLLGGTSVLMPAVPAAQRHLAMEWLHRPADYAIVGLAALASSVLLGLTWRLVLPVVRMPSAEHVER